MYDKGVDFATNLEYMLAENDLNYTNFEYDVNKFSASFNVGNFRFMLQLNVNRVNEARVEDTLNELTSYNLKVYDTTSESVSKKLSIWFLSEILGNSESLEKNGVGVELESSETLESIKECLGKTVTELLNMKKYIFEESRQGYFANVLANKFECEYARIYSSDYSENIDYYFNMIMLSRNLDSKGAVGLFLWQGDTEKGDVDVSLINVSENEDIDIIKLGTLSDDAFRFKNIQAIYDSRLLKLCLIAFNDYIRKDNESE